jgi:hypothetical protein
MARKLRPLPKLIFFGLPLEAEIGLSWIFVEALLLYLADCLPRKEQSREPVTACDALSIDGFNACIARRLTQDNSKVPVAPGQLRAKYFTAMSLD